jgi:RND family efflux transporter MFP subunit
VTIAADVGREGILLGLIALVTAAAGCSDQGADSTARSEAPSGHLVTTIIAERAPVAMQYERPGSLALRRVVRIYSQEEGRITALEGFEGDRVREGQTLVGLEDALLRAELDAARATRAQERLDLRRFEGLSKRGGASEDEIAQARTAVAVAEAQVRLLETRLAYTQIAAPFDGLITQRLVEPGDFVAKNTQLLTVADPASLLAEVPVSELVLPELAVGDAAQIRIDALGGLHVPGTILRIHPTLSEAGRQATVEVALARIPEGARAGQFVRVSFSSVRVPRLLVPFRALRQDRNGTFVWIVDADGKATRREVDTGVRVGDEVEILHGLDSGNAVITRGFLGLSVGDEVRVVEAPPL